MNLFSAYLAKSSTQRVLNRKPGDKGFSLIELVVVVAVLAILAAIAVPAFMGMSESAADAAMEANLKNAYKECAYQIARGKDSSNQFNRELTYPNFEFPGDDGFYTYTSDTDDETSNGGVHSCYEDNTAKDTTTMTATKSGKTDESDYANGAYTIKVTSGVRAFTAAAE